MIYLEDVCSQGNEIDPKSPYHIYIYIYIHMSHQEEPAHLQTPPATPWSSLSPKSLVHLHILAFAPQVQVAFNFTQLSRMGAVQSLEVDHNSSWMIQNLVAFMVDPKEDFMYFPSSSSSSSSSSPPPPPSSSSSSSSSQKCESDQMKTAQYESFSLPQNTESPNNCAFQLGGKKLEGKEGDCLVTTLPVYGS